MKYKKGDMIIDKDGYKSKILAILDGLYLSSGYDDFEYGSFCCTEKYLDDNGYTLFIREKEKFVPKKGDRYSFVYSDGSIDSCIYRNDEVDNYRLSTGNCFHPDDIVGAEEYKKKLLELGK